MISWWFPSSNIYKKYHPILIHERFIYLNLVDFYTVVNVLVNIYQCADPYGNLFLQGGLLRPRPLGSRRTKMIRKRAPGSWPMVRHGSERWFSAKLVWIGTLDSCFLKKTTSSSSATITTICIQESVSVFLGQFIKHFVNVVGKSMGYTMRFCLLATCVLRWPNFIQIPPCEIPESKRYGFKWLLVMTWIHLPEPSNIVKFQPPRSVFGFFGG